MYRKARIHICGIGPRMGTTLMKEALGSCTNIDLYDTQERRVFSRPKKECGIYLSKDPRHILDIGPALAVNPRLFVICMIRDPRDMVSSKHERNKEAYYAGLKYWKTFLSVWQGLRSHPRVLTISYEELTTRPDETQDKIVEKIPYLKKEVPFSKYHEIAAPSEFSTKALGSVRPIRPTSVGKWRRHRERVAGQLKLHGPITKNLIKLGYEKDDAWLRELKGVAPDTSESHDSEYFSQSDIMIQRIVGYAGAVVVLARRLGLDPLKPLRHIPRQWLPAKLYE